MQKAIEKWADRVYSENDFGRSIATSLSGTIGLVIYLIFNDWVIAAFSTIISFPIIRVISTGLHEKAERRKLRKIDKEEAQYIYNQLSDEEKDVLKSFVKEGGSVLTWGQMNNQPVNSAAIESLIQRGVLWTSMTADGMTETFAINSNLFDIGYRKYNSK